MSKSPRLEFARSLATLIALQLAFAGVVTHFAAAGPRPLVLMGLGAVVTMVVAAISGLPTKRKIAAILLATVVSGACILGWRRFVDPAAFAGAIPSSLEIPALAANAVLAILFGVVVVLASKPDSRAYRMRWGIVLCLSIIVTGSLAVLCAFRLQSTSTISMQMLQVLRWEEQLASVGPFERQQLSFYLTALGRGPEATAFSIWPESPAGRLGTSNEEPAKWEEAVPLSACDGRQAIRQIAARERMVILMEAHNATQHREWIEQTLPIFHEAGFRHYAAEGLHESGVALKTRGFPVFSTGAYVSDPRFGNLLRRAIELGFVIHEYEALLASEIPEREEQQAQSLADIFKSDPDCRIVIHVGFAHAFKQPVPGGGKWMAARLWEKTGIEPCCIYQGSDAADSPGYARLVELAGASDEPTLLMPPPRDLPDPQFAGIPPGAIDALVVHPPTKGKPPSDRKPVYSENMTHISGRWLAREWPVVVGAYRPGEPADAIPLDQVMLRSGEAAFALWLPSPAYELRVISTAGKIEIDAEDDGGEIRLRRAGGS